MLHHKSNSFFFSTQTHKNKLGGNVYVIWRDLRESCSLLDVSVSSNTGTNSLHIQMAHLHAIAHKFKWLMKMWTGHQNEVNAKKTNQHCPLKTFLICPHESSPASSIKLVTVNDSDDSSHLTKTAWNNLTSHPMQFGFGTFRWPTFYIHLNTSHYTSHIYHVCMLFTLPTEASQRFTLQCFLFLYHRKKKTKKNLLTWPECLTVITTHKRGAALVFSW